MTPPGSACIPFILALLCSPLSRHGGAPNLRHGLKAGPKDGDVCSGGTMKKSSDDAEVSGHQRMHGRVYIYNIYIYILYIYIYIYIFI